MPFDVEPLRRELRRQQQAFGREAQREVHQALTAAAPIDTGELVNSVATTNLSVSDNRVEFTAETGDLIQAETTEFGRKGFSAKNKQALRFTINGQTVIVKSVGPAPAKPWFHPTLAKWPQIAERAWRRVSR